MRKIELFTLVILTICTIGCGSRNDKEKANSSLETPEESFVENFNQNLFPTGSGFIVTIKNNFTYESQKFFKNNLFDSFNHFFIYDTLYYDSLFPNSLENNYSIKNRNDANFKRAFHVQIPKQNISYKNTLISYDVDAAIQLCQSKEFVESVHQQGGGIASNKAYPKSDTFNNWWVSDINASTAWYYSTGSLSVKIGILDDGIQANHPNLANINTNLSCSFVQNLSATAPTNSHGTSMAGLIAGIPSASYPAFSGIAPYCDVISLRILDSGDYLASSYALACAINYAQTNGIQVLALSYTLTASQMTQDLINAINNYTGVIFCAAGNKYYSLDNPPINDPDDLYKDRYPSVYGFNNVISIASSNTNHKCISNFGHLSVDFAAPGTDLWTTVINSSMESVAGSSFATPMAAGAYALLKSYYPCLSNSSLLYYLMNNLSTMDTSIASPWGISVPYLNQPPGTWPTSTETVTNGILNIGASFNALAAHKTYTSISSTQHHVGCNCSQSYDYGNEAHTFELTMTLNGMDYIPVYVCTKCGYSTNHLPF